MTFGELAGIFIRRMRKNKRLTFGKLTGIFIRRMKKNKHELNSNALLPTHYGRINLPMLIKPETLAELTAEGFRLLAQDEKRQKKTKPEKTVNANNPYFLARNEIIKTFDKIKCHRIEEMEKGTRERNHQYDDFVKQIIKLGDKYSDSQ